MIELRFHRELYAGTSVDAAAQTFRDHAALELAEDGSHWIVRVTVADPESERAAAGELGNFALGLSIRDRGARA